MPPQSAFSSNKSAGHQLTLQSSSSRATPKMPELSTDPPRTLIHMVSPSAHHRHSQPPITSQSARKRPYPAQREREKRREGGKTTIQEDHKAIEMEEDKARGKEGDKARKMEGDKARGQTNKSINTHTYIRNCRKRRKFERLEYRKYMDRQASIWREKQKQEHRARARKAKSSTQQHRNTSVRSKHQLPNINTPTPQLHSISHTPHHTLLKVWSEDEKPKSYDTAITVDGHIYYINHITKTTSWHHPSAPPLQQDGECKIQREDENIS